MQWFSFFFSDQGVDTSFLNLSQDTDYGEVRWDSRSQETIDSVMKCEYVYICFYNQEVNIRFSHTVRFLADILITFVSYKVEDLNFHL